ncbi:hypothetical protein ABW20_dc0100914 [Dactylellina cionopaga]|nr:hypothetical protein ABW20_dc0100914 [Dactylellina cionopaga]
MLNSVKALFEKTYGSSGQLIQDDYIEVEAPNKDFVNSTDEVAGDQSFSSENTYESAIPSDHPLQQTPKRNTASIGELEDTNCHKIFLRGLSSSPPINIGSSTANEASLGYSNIESNQDDEDTEDGTTTIGGTPRPLQEIKKPSSKSQQKTSKDTGWSLSMFGSGIDEDEDDFVDIEETLRENERQQAIRGT